MSYAILIKYTAPVAPTDAAVNIPSVYVPNNAAADLDVFEGTYYDTNVEGFGVGTDLETFMNQSIAHPGLVAALRTAIKDGTYAYETDDQDKYNYILNEVGPQLADAGFEFIPGDSVEVGGEGAEGFEPGPEIP